MTKRDIKLGGFILKYEARIAIKSQVLTDFIVEFSVDLQLVAKKEMYSVTKGEDKVGKWTLLVDGASNY